MFILIFFFYNLVWLIAIILAIPYYIYLLLKKKFFIVDDRLSFSEIKKDDYLWIHASSVGETKIAENIIKEIRKNSMQPILLTVVTKTGYNLAKKINAQYLEIRFAPYDFIFCVFNFINKTGVKKLLLLETELWPSYIIACNLEEIPVYIVNARISDKSFGKYKKFKFLFSRILKNVNLICAQTNEYKKRLVEIGASNHKISIVDNLKYDLLNDVSDDKFLAEIFKNKKIITAGSVRGNEPEILIDTFLKLKEKFSDLVLVIAPRHLENVSVVEKILNAKKISSIKLSMIKNNFNQDVVIVDVMGRLTNLYKYSQIVFVGGSLVDKGGQNIIEPAFLGKPIVVGKYMYNFKETTDLLLKNNAIIQIDSQDKLYNAFEKLFLDNELKLGLGSRAKNTIIKKQGGTKKTLEIVGVL